MLLFLFPFRFYLWLAKVYGGNSGHTAGLGAGLMAIATIFVLYAILAILVIGGLFWFAFG